MKKSLRWMIVRANPIAVMVGACLGLLVGLVVTSTAADPRMGWHLPVMYVTMIGYTTGMMGTFFAIVSSSRREGSLAWWTPCLHAAWSYSLAQGLVAGIIVGLAQTSPLAWLFATAWVTVLTAVSYGLGMLSTGGFMILASRLGNWVAQLRADERQERADQKAARTETAAPTDPPPDDQRYPDGHPPDWLNKTDF